MIPPCQAGRVGRDGQAVRPAAVAAVVVLVAGLALVALTARSGRTETVRPITAVATPGATATGTATSALPTRPPDGDRTSPPSSGTDAPPSLMLFVLLVLLLVVIATAVAGWMSLQRRSAGPGRYRTRRRAPERDVGGAEPADPAVLVAAVEAGLRDLEDGSPGEGVVACWVQLERAAEDAGAGRAAPETPSELAGRLIDTHGVESGPLVRLAELYREARYSTHPVPEGARTEARALLEEVRADLALAAASLAVSPGPGTGRRRPR